MIKAPTRRRARLRSSHYASERWKPSPILLVLLVGIAVGAFLGIRGRLSGNADSLQEHYLLLVSDLYAQGAPLTVVHDRLAAVGYSNPAVSVLAVADQLASSRDTIKQQEADQLRLFSDALATGAAQSDTSPSTQSSAQSTPLAQPSPTAASAAAGPLGGEIVEPTATVAPAATPIAIPSTVAGAPPIVTPPPGGDTEKATIVTVDRRPAIVRKEATTKSPSVGIAPYGAAVTVEATVQGEAVESGDARWYQVSYNGKDGYIYAQLVKVGG